MLIRTNVDDSYDNRGVTADNNSSETKLLCALSEWISSSQDDSKFKITLSYLNHTLKVTPKAQGKNDPD